MDLCQPLTTDENQPMINATRGMERNQDAHSFREARIAKYMARAIDAETSRVAGASAGRNIQLNESSFALGKLVGTGKLLRSEAESALRSAARKAGLDDKEIEDTLDSGLSAGIKEPADISHVGTGQCKKPAAPRPPNEPKPITPKTSKKSKHKEKPIRKIPYLYEDDDTGEPLYLAVRQEYPTESKDVWLEVVTGYGADGRVLSKGYKGCMDGVRRVLYKGREVKEADPSKPVWIVEGEKKVEALRKWDLVATCNSEGAKKWKDEYSLKLAGRSVYILPDNNKPGLEHAVKAATSLKTQAASVKIVELHGLAENEDVVDWIAKGATLAELVEIGDITPEWEPGPAIAGKTTLSIAEESGKPDIILGIDIYRVLDEADDCLANADEIYARGTDMVRVLPYVGRRKKREPERVEGTPQLVRVDGPSLTEILALHANWIQVVDKGEGPEEKLVVPPQNIVQGLLSRKVWKSLRYLEGVVESPTIRWDGSVLQDAGWDDETGLLYQPNALFQAVPDRPTLEDARGAAKEILELVSDFPFIDDTHRCAWLAALLTVLARAIIDGPTPFFLLNSNMRGTGKSYLVHLISILASGRVAACQPYPDDDEEMRKLLLSLAICADFMLMFDNIESGTRVGLPSLDAALSSRTIQGRLLGKSERVTLPWNVVGFGTGNNVGTKGDMMRRLMPIGLETSEVSPEERDDFKVKGSILDYARKERPRLVKAALVILRAHALAGRPEESTLKPMGGFEAWSKVVRSAVVWATGTDP